jgi:hypothetical protein
VKSKHAKIKPNPNKFPGTKADNMPKLEIYQSLWGMQLNNTRDGYRPHEEAFSEVAAAGYSGLCLDPGVSQIDDFLNLKPLYEQHRLGCLVNVFPQTVAEMRPLLEFCSEMGAPFANVIGQVFPISVDGAIPVIRSWLEISEDVGVPIKMETHRDCITNDMFFTLQLLDAIPEMRLTADLSHYMLNREMSAPISSQNQMLVQRILERSDSFQGRVSSHEQIQVPLGFPQNQKWVEIHKDWWRRGFQSWLGRASEEDKLIFLCELGPPEYAMTDADNRELSDRFEEADIIRGWVEEMWHDLQGPSV